MNDHKNHIKPPRWSQKLLRLFIREEYLEEIEGDLEELFEDNLEQHSIRKANRYYNKEVLKAFRLSLLKPMISRHQTNNLALVKHNLTSSIRSFKRYKVSFLTNLTGLAMAMTAALLIFLWISDERSMDRFHEKDGRLYQVMRNRVRPEGITTNTDTPSLLAKALKEAIPGIEYSVTTNRSTRNSGILSSEDKRIEVSGAYASQDFFSAFSYGLLRGESDRVLQNRNQIVLSESTATALFGTTENIIGKTVKGNKDLLRQEYYITGVFEDTPYHSTAQFDFVISYKTLLAKRDWLNDWNADGANTYITLKPGTDPGAFGEKIKSFLSDKPDRKGNDLFIQQYSSLYLHGTYSNGKPSGGRISYIRLFTLVAAIILVMSCINFVNLSTAQASRKMKQVGLKKTLGVKRRTLALQFMTETLLTSLLAFFLAAILAWLLLPAMNELTGKTLEHNMGPHMMYYGVLLALLTGIVSGIYPALYLSGFQAIAVLKNKIPGSLGDLWIRKGLVTVQFVLSVAFITTFQIVDQQVQFVQQANLGYDRENVIHFTMRNRNGQVSFLSALQTIPGVEQASYQSGGSVVRMQGSGGGFSWGDPSTQEDIIFGRPHIGYGFTETLDIELIEGRGFSRDFANEEMKLIINESAARIIGIENIVGKTIKDGDDEKQVIGIVRDFNTQSLYEPIKPAIMRFSSSGSDILVRLNTKNRRESIEKIEALYGQFDQDYPFRFSFIGDEYQRLYVSEQRVSDISRYFTVIACTIAFLGLFGLVTFTIQQRIKEVGIRKVLGLNTIGIIKLLSAGITKTVMLGTLIALPISYLLADRWLNGFAYRIELHWQFFLLIGLATLFSTWLIVALRLFKTARTNPIHYLRNE